VKNLAVGSYGINVVGCSTPQLIEGHNRKRVLVLEDDGGERRARLRAGKVVAAGYGEGENKQAWQGTYPLE
jgi:hypothetical protein